MEGSYFWTADGWAEHEAWLARRAAGLARGRVEPVRGEGEAPVPTPA